MKYVFSSVYSVILTVLMLLSIPRFIYSYTIQKKYRQSIWARFCIGFPKIKTASIWIHCVSVGETKAAASLAKLLKKQYPTHELIISTVTETGHAEAKRSISCANHYVFLPFDFKWMARKAINLAKPALVIICETDYWYHFLSQAKRAGASTLVVNGKISENSLKNFLNFSFFSHRLFTQFDLFLVQNAIYKERFKQLSIPENKIVVTGNLKTDEEYTYLKQNEIDSWKDLLGIMPQQKVVTFGSTHEDEEKFLLTIARELWNLGLDFKLILVPRHPERINQLKDHMSAEGFSFVCYSQCAHKTGLEKVILVDVMGLLRTFYQLTTIALVGGSFIETVGGHNVLEPCKYGKPVLFGPYTYKQAELVEMVKEAQAGLQLNRSEVKDILKKWLSDSHHYEQMGINGLEMTKKIQGSLFVTFEQIKNLMAKRCSTDKLQDTSENNEK